MGYSRHVDILLIGFNAVGVTDVDGECRSVQASACSVASDVFVAYDWPNTMGFVSSRMRFFR